MDSFIPPLTISNKNQSHSRDAASPSSTTSSKRLFSAFRSQLRTLPLTPHSSREEMVDRSSLDRSPFPKYLRAFYPFLPDTPVSASWNTLPLNKNDVFLVHSVHTSGWADGTLLDTGTRGWLPTNYCETYDQQLVRPLLKALVDFWDVIHDGSGANLHQFTNQDYTKGITAGVRYLLKKSDCFKMKDPLVQRFTGLRRNRKALLSDVSSLLILARHLRDIANGAPLDEPLDTIFDEMLLRALRIVARGIRFVDVWNEEVETPRMMAELRSPTHSIPFNYEEPLTPPVDSSFNFGESWGSSNFCTPESSTSAGSRPDSRLRTYRSTNMSSAPQVSYDESDNQPRPPSVQTKRGSVSHRVSYTGHSSATQNPNLACERLSAAYDDFLGVLGSFIGLHLQSRSSTELILTTQQAVQSCRRLLGVVEEVWEHDLHRSKVLEEAKDTMYERITELVHAAHDAFRPANNGEEEPVFMPEDGKRLVDAATHCVRGAGDCVAKTRQVLEQIGDFELENVGLGITTPETTPRNNANREVKPEPIDIPTVKPDVPPKSSNRMLPPPLKIPAASLSNLSLTPSLTDAPTPSPGYLATTVHTPTSTLDEPFSAALSSFSQLGDSLIPHPDFNDSSIDLSLFPASPSEKKTFGEISRGVSSCESERTYVNGGIESQTTTAIGTRAPSPADQPPPAPSKDEAPLPRTPVEETETSEECLLAKTFAPELMFKDGQVIGGSLRALVEKLTAHESTPDPMFVTTFYLTFRHFASPLDFAEALVERYDYVGDSPGAGGPVRLRVSNVLKNWLETHWRHDCDDVALPCILSFARNKLMATLPTAGKRLIDLIDKISESHAPLVPRLVSAIGKTNTSVAQYINPNLPVPSSNVSKSQMNALKQWKNGGQNVSIVDFDPLEVARQLTLKASGIFCSILPEELLGTEWMKKSASLAVNVRAMSTLSTDITNFVADTILQLEEPKKRAVVVKQWVKIASKCLELNNYDTLMAIICSLNSSTISRLRRTWELVSQRTKNVLEQLREIVDVSRNYAVLRQRLQNHVPPCLPFVGTYLTDLTFVDHGNQDTRTLSVEDDKMEVINFDKHMKTAKIISELQRFQIPYRLAEVAELQTWIQDQLVRVRSAGEKTFQNYYRRSLVLEPRERAQRTAPNDASFTVFLKENAKEKFDFLAWTQSSKAKAAPA